LKSWAAKEIISWHYDIRNFLKYVKIQEPNNIALEYQLWPHLIDFYSNLRNHRLNILLKSKQLGISWAFAIRAILRMFLREGSNILMLSSGEKEAQQLLAKAKTVYFNLPEWLQVQTLDSNSTEQFGFKGMKSMITALPSTVKAGIGHTADWVIHDEADFHDYFEQNLGHTLATVADDPHRELTISSTVDKTRPDSPFKNLFRAAQNNLNNFNPLFYPYDARPDRSEIWYEERVRENESTPWVVLQNWPRSIEEALSPQSATSCFNQDVLNDLWDNRIDSPQTRQNHIFILHPPRVGVTYSAGVDVGEGVGLDYSSLTILGKYGMESEVCAQIYTNKLGTDLFAYDVNSLCREYFNPKLAVDNIGIGRAVVDKLIELGYPNLYQDKKKYGWNLTEPNKKHLVIKLVEAINNRSLITRFKPQIQELMEYQWINGRPEPTGKTHGDTVISLMLANEMLKYSGVIRKPTMYIGGELVQL